MPLHVRPIAVSIAVITFFVLSIAGLLTKLSPFTSCKRAIIGAALTYVAASIAVHIINAILTHAIIESHANKQKEQQRVG
jgi:FtsH-binding integral membrane protein